MSLDAMLRILRALRCTGVRVWVDGGWGVDALLGRVTRPHDDLDVAVGRRGLEALLRWGATAGYTLRPGQPPENPVLERGSDRIDVHAFAYAPDGAVAWGIAYPYGSLTGRGTLGGEVLDCVAAEWMYRFKTSYPPRDRDRADVRTLAEAFGYALPDGY